MQTRTFAHHLNALIEGVNAAALNEILAKYIGSDQNVGIPDEDKRRFAATIFGIQAYLARIDSVEESLAKALGLTSLFDPAHLAALLTTFQNSPNSGTLRNQHLFLNLFHATGSLLRTNAIVQRELVQPKERVHTAEDSILSLEIVDYDNDGVTLHRLAAICDALVALYAAVDQYLGRRTSPRVAYADSGSNITLGLEGAKDTIDAIGDLFGRAWNALRFRKHDEFERTLESALKGINFLASLKGQQASGAIDAETAAKLEVAVKKQMGELVGAGVMIEETDNTAHYDRRELLTAVRDQKLIGPGREPETPNS
jgi:hypothetical protein